MVEEDVFIARLDASEVESTVPQDPFEKYTHVQSDHAWSHSSGGKLLLALDRMNAKMEVSGDTLLNKKLRVADVVVGNTASVSAGYIVWALQGGFLVSRMLSSIPLWKGFDPLPVIDTKKTVYELDENNKRKQEQKADESLDPERLFAG